MDGDSWTIPQVQDVFDGVVLDRYLQRTMYFLVQVYLTEGLLQRNENIPMSVWDIPV